MVQGGGAGSLTGAPYVTHLADIENKEWATRKSQGLKQIPTVSAGADVSEDRSIHIHPYPSMQATLFCLLTYVRRRQPDSLSAAWIYIYIYRIVPVLSGPCHGVQSIGARHMSRILLWKS
jgi:hypothetical protein